MKKIVGFWNPSVILTYIGMSFAILGMYLAVKDMINFAFICLVLCGICDLFDGVIAKKFKRSEDEKAFGIELDSLVDVLSFIALPVTLFMNIGFDSALHLIIYVLYSIAGIARLGYFNVVTADEDGPVKYYSGLPITYAALVFSLMYLTINILSPEVFVIVYTFSMIAVTVLEVLKIKIAKPRGLAYIFFGVLAIAVIALFIITA
ncbi:MAG: CDP-alcohol phosphatidyltransferase family protein [Lachnospiraceae bacterium]|nr:CDP-alcohol phosphatidyltransferase family protein [Lachnospiraceae bacterium]